MTGPVLRSPWNDVEAFLGEPRSPEEQPDYLLRLGELNVARGVLMDQLSSSSALPTAAIATVVATTDLMNDTESNVTTQIDVLTRQLVDREKALKDVQTRLGELEARIELANAMPEIRSVVAAAKRAHNLSLLAKKLPAVLRQVTELSKAASEQLVNQNFEALFAEECKVLRAPDLRLEFVGRQGKAQRRKVMVGRHRPSHVLSEGEQKVIALADFLAEARLTGITAPVVFDDPVTSLDHRRINEVADRVAALAVNNQVIVFTHDILFATSLLARFEKTTRCSYLQVTDEGGKGQIAHGTGPRWDTVKNLTKHVNETIAAAKKETGESRAALIRTGYDWIRSWCEVFAEMELLQEVTQRYQPNVKMTMLSKIKTEALPAAIEVVTEVFEKACRHIDGHSQPLATLAVAPTLDGLEQDWLRLTDARKTYLSA